MNSPHLEEEDEPLMAAAHPARYEELSLEDSPKFMPKKPSRSRNIVYKTFMLSLLLVAISGCIIYKSHSPTRCPFPYNHLTADATRERAEHLDLGKSTTGAFSMSLSWSSQECYRFSVWIVRTSMEDCALAEQHSPASDTAHGTYMSGRGPDSFRLVLKGAERYASEEHIYEGNCRYRFDVTAGTAGPVGLKLYHLFEVRR